VILYVFIIALALGYTLLIAAYRYGWQRIPVFDKRVQKFHTPVTIVVAARNEASNIERLLHDLANQQFPEALYEIIVVDDFSDDGTAGIVRHFPSPIVRLITLAKIAPAYLASKKLAITAAVQQARGRLIVTTDADCRVGPHWLPALVSYYETHRPKVIAGPVIFEQEDSFFKKFQSLDFLSMMGITAACIGLDFPNMCNGANLAYEKAAFQEAGGFEGVDHLPTGDDILLVLKIQRQHPGSVHFLKSLDAMVKTYPQPTLPTFIDQRIRWLSKSTAFQDKRITAILVGAWLFNAAILGFFALGISGQPALLAWAGGLFGLKLGMDLIFLVPVLRFFQRTRLLFLFLPIQILHLFYVVIIGLVANFLPYSWKGRSYRNKLFGKTQTASR